MGDMCAGAFAMAVGADNSLKQELDPGLMASNKVVVDVLEQFAAIVDLHHAIKVGVMSKLAVYAEVDGIVTERMPGRISDE
jgi:ornithine cyclodeaminase/alanine dehydrogenase-like protein (mu-crystallin family)